MIDLYYWVTPNGHKITMFLEEAGLEYRLVPVDINKGEQFAPRFAEVSPNRRIPAIVDHDPPGRGKSVRLFESGAILLYLAERTGSLLPSSLQGRAEALQWLFWQASCLGPIAGTNLHFRLYAPEKLPYVLDRYSKENHRLYEVMEERLAEREYLARSYSIADIACYPWVLSHERQGLDLREFPNIARWLDLIAERPATKRAYARGETIAKLSPPAEVEVRRRLFGG
jgi:GST-like protein